MADVDAKVWDLVALEGVESSADPFGQGGEPPPDPASWNLPATLNVQQDGTIGLRQYTVNATGWTISVSDLPAGVTYNAGLERLEGASTGTASATATFTLTLGATTVVDTATVALVAAPVSEYTPTHYVTAAASGGGDGSLGSPWTLAQAMANAVAGNVVRVGPGVYTASPNGSSWTPGWHPANSGTSENPIVFMAQNTAVYLSDVFNNSDRTELRSGTTSQTGAGNPTFGADNRNYVRWHGFALNESVSGTRTEKAPVVVNVSTGVHIESCYLLGTTALWSDNHSGVRGESSSGMKVLNCHIEGFYDSGGSHSWGVLMYGCTNYEISNCEITDCYGGVYPKGVQSGDPDLVPGAIHHNYIHDCSSRCMEIGGVGQDDGPGYLDIYQNIIDNCFLRMQSYNTTSPSQWRIVNNLFRMPTTADDGVIYCANSPVSGDGRWDDSLFQNNIVQPTGTTRLYRSYQATTPAILAAKAPHDYNCYQGITQYFNDYTIGSWQAAGLDANSLINTDPQLSNPASGDFRLGGSSPCLGAGLDVLNLLNGGTGAPINIGPYILPGQTDEIGVRSNG